MCEFENLKKPKSIAFDIVVGGGPGGGKCLTFLLSGTSSIYQADRHSSGSLITALYNQPWFIVCDMCVWGVGGDQKFSTKLTVFLRILTKAI